MRSVILLACLATQLDAQWTHRSCPLPAGSKGYPVTASSAALDSATLMQIARGAAGAWPDDTTFRARPQQSAFADLMKLLSRPEVHSREGWIPSEADTVTMTLRYRRGAEVQIWIDTAARFSRRIAFAMAGELSRARLGYVQHDTLPLRLDAVDSADVVVRFGYEPDGGQIVTRFARIEAPVTPGRNMLGPRYPARQRSRNVQGTVNVAFVVEPDGRVNRDGIRVLSSPDGDFTESVRTFLRSANFTPATVDCQRVSRIVRQPFNFTLSRDLPPGAYVP